MAVGTCMIVSSPDIVSSTLPCLKLSIKPAFLIIWACRTAHTSIIFRPPSWRVSRKLSSRRIFFRTAQRPRRIGGLFNESNGCSNHLDMYWRASLVLTGCLKDHISCVMIIIISICLTVVWAGDHEALVSYLRSGHLLSTCIREY